MNPSGSAPTRTKILVVEDEGVVALDLEQQLERLGFTVVGLADSAAEALAQVRARRPDLVLMDIRIRGPLDGIDLARALSTQYEVPVVFLTGNADEATLERAVAAEPYGYVLKPFELRALEATVRTALFRHRAERSTKTLQHWLGDALSSVPDPLLCTDLEGRVSFLNHAAESLLGMTLAEALLRPLAEVLPGEAVTLAARRVAERPPHSGRAAERLAIALKGEIHQVAVGPIAADGQSSGVIVTLSGRAN